MKYGFWIFVFLAGSINFYAFNNVSNKLNDSLYSKERFIEALFKMPLKSPKVAFEYFNKGANYFKKKKDTANYLHCIIQLSDIEMRKGQFNNAFELLWEAFPQASKISDKKPLYKIHQLLGILYGVFGKDSMALSHTKKGLQIALQQVKRNNEDASSAISSYLDVAVQYVEMEHYDEALNYLDSCYFIHNKKERLFFIDGFYGFVHLKKGNLEKSKYYLNGVAPYLELNGFGFQTSVNFYLGELKFALNEIDSAVYYYSKSIKAIDSLQANLKLKPKVLEQLSLAYFKNNNSEKAFLALQQSKIISDSLFNTQSKQNSLLFEIKNRYKEDLLKKAGEIDAQNELLKLNQKAKFRLQLVIAILILLVFVALITFGLMYKMKRMAYKQAIVNEKNDAILEVKNKELTAHALQIIERDQAVKELLATIMENSPEKFKLLNHKYKQGNKKKWDDFHLRFTQTNEKFYTNLLAIYPELTSTDLKHCALIRLNFDSKEMSQLLGISINSVHMARSRIRKKLNLKREASLTTYLSSL